MSLHKHLRVKEGPEVSTKVVYPFILPSMFHFDQCIWSQMIYKVIIFRIITGISIKAVDSIKSSPIKLKFTKIPIMSSFVACLLVRSHNVTPEASITDFPWDFG